MRKPEERIFAAELEARIAIRRIEKQRANLPEGDSVRLIFLLILSSSFAFFYHEVANACSRTAEARARFSTG
jgi:hypothetical protein